MDNIDGKQARKTGQSSPLGMIFDHGCDAFNTVLNSMAIGKLFVISTHWQAFGVVMATSPFYFATLEQYYTHSLELPVINAPNEGQTFVILLAIYGAIKGRPTVN